MEVKRQITPRSRSAWRKWLENNPGETRVRVIRYKKHTKKRSPNYQELLDEAICFGWIDTTMNRIDDERYATTFVKRKSTASWSKNTLSYAKRLIEEGRMTAPGLKAYKLGLKKKPIDHGLPKHPDTPVDLKKALAKNKKAEENFNKFSPSARKPYIYRILRAKRPETREKRIKEVVERAKLNKRISD